MLLVMPVWSFACFPPKFKWPCFYFLFLWLFISMIKFRKSLLSILRFCLALFIPQRWFCIVLICCFARTCISFRNSSTNLVWLCFVWNPSDSEHLSEKRRLLDVAQTLWLVLTWIKVVCFSQLFAVTQLLTLSAVSEALLYVTQFAFELVNSC